MKFFFRYRRRRYYQIHARKDESGTRSFLADSVALSRFDAPLGLDICFGTGAVLTALPCRHPRGVFLGKSS